LAFTLFMALALGEAFGQTALEQRVVELINVERTNHDLPPYIWHDKLASIARAHSEDMLRSNSVSSTRSDGSNVAQMVSQGGITNTTGRSIAVYGGGNTPEQRVAAWIDTTSTRAAILHEDRSHVAVSIVQRPASSTANSSAYWTLLIINVPLELSPSEIRAFELRMFELTNIERVNHGLSALIWNDTLSDAARAHSEDLMRNNISGHTGSDGSTVRQRIERAGVIASGFSENIHYGSRTPEAAVASLMNSPGHRANILNENRTHLGVGLVSRPEDINAQYAMYWTQKFATIR